MLFLARCWIAQGKRFIERYRNDFKLGRLLSVSFLLITVVIELVPMTHVQANLHTNVATSVATNVATVGPSCSQITHSADGNPFPLCPGPYPQGGNCTWWSWEQWHVLGYNLPDNWGNAADWIVDATRAGLPIGTAPRKGSIAVFPHGDGVWASSPAGHVAFVINVSSDNQNFTVTYQNYGDPNFMYVGRNYNTSVINQPQFQNGGLRFIYFPFSLNAQLFAKLPGISVKDPVDAMNQANAAIRNRVPFGHPPVSTGQ